MPLKVTDAFVFGGVDSRSNPANFRTDRALRCINWEPQPGGALQLRRGYTDPAMSTADTVSGAIHSACYYETIFPGPITLTRLPEIGTSLSGTGTPWTNPNNVTLDTSAVASVSITPGTPSNRLYAFGFNLEIPANATINKIQVDVRGNGDTGFNPLDVYLTFDGATLSPLGAFVNLPMGASQVIPDVAGPIDLWGYTIDYSDAFGSGSSPTINDLNGSPFGVFLIAPGFYAYPFTARINSVKVTVIGTVPGRPGEFVLYGQAKNVKVYNVQTGGVSAPATVAGDTSGVRTSMQGSPWGFFRANGKVFFNDGFGPVQSYDGLLQRAAGIRAPVTAETAPVVVSDITGSTVGSMSTTSLGGYQLYMAYYNPKTGQVGNRAAIGGRVNITSPTDYILVSGLPNILAPLPDSSPEWQIVIGGTNDGGSVPYWLTDPAGNRLIVATGGTAINFPTYNLDYNGELPFLNDPPPPGLAMFANVLNTIFGATGTDYFIYISNNINLATTGNYVGRPEESWPGDQLESFPTGEVVTGLFSYNFQGWFFSRNNLAQFSESLVQAGSDPWLGPWPVGCAGKRAFVVTPYGPFWVTGDKQLATFGYWGPVPVSEEYERALLAKIGDAYLSLTEIAYIRDPNTMIDRLHVLGFDANGAPICVVHDFKLREQTNAYMAPGEGQGYARTYPTLVPSTFVRVAPEDTRCKDASGRIRLWAGAGDGQFHQLEDGTYEGANTATTFTADYLGLIPQGQAEPRVPGVSWFGDGNTTVSFSMRATAELADFLVAPTKVLKDTQNLFEAQVASQGQFMYLRLQLTSHPADGNFDLTDPPQVPMNPYGVVLGMRFKEGARREEARR